jgi:hypothetical protein
MSIIYKVGIGHNVAEIDLVTIVPQPTCKGIRATRRTQSASGRVVDEGLHTYYEWNVMQGVAAWNSVLALFDMDSPFVLAMTLTSEVTVIVRNQLWLPVRVNAIAVLPRIGEDAEWSNYRPRNLMMLLKHIQTAT